jgi:phage terminase large subunit-like protein
LRQLSRDDFTRIYVCIDPAATSGEEADDTGIIVTARGPCQPEVCKLAQQGVQCPGHGYVLADFTCHLPPIGWAKEALKAFDMWRADRVVAEINNGGSMVEATIRAVRPGVPYSTVYATRGKMIRAEPVSALFEQGRGHMVGEFRELETELTTWTQDAGWSPNRLDALVWGFTELGLIGDQGWAFMSVMKNAVAARPDEPRLSPAMKALPSLGDTSTPTLRAGCKHRYFGPEHACVYCGGIETAATVVAEPMS